MGQINYSVIIPTRNIPDLLQRCLASIPEREDIEIIVVDDNSDPKIVDFDNYPGKARSNVRIIFAKEGKGAGYARNIGMSYAVGKWLVFADSDDFFLPQINIVLDKYVDDESDIVFFDIDSVFSDNLAPSPRHKNRSNALKKLQGKALEKYCRYKYTEPWGKIIKKTLVERKGIRFDETPVANDYMFSIKTGHYATMIKYDPTVLYCLTTRPGSLSFRKADSEAKVNTRLGVYDDVQRFFVKEKISYRPFSEFAFSTWLNNKEYRKIITDYCKNKDLSFSRVFLGYCVEKFKSYI